MSSILHSLRQKKVLAEAQLVGIQFSLRKAQGALHGIEGAIMLQYSVLAERAYKYSMANGAGSGEAYYREMFDNPRGDERELLRAIHTRKNYRASFDQIIQATGRRYLDMKAHIEDLEVFIQREENLIAVRSTGIGSAPSPHSQ